MKKLDSLSRFEKAIYNITSSVCFLGIPIAITLLVDKIFLEDAKWFIGYPILLICFCVGMLLSFAIAATMEEILDTIFNRIRKIFKRKTLRKIEEEIREKEREEEYQEVKREEKIFKDLPVDDKLYRIWTRHNSLQKEIEDIRKVLKWVFILVFFIMIFLLTKLF